MAVNAIIEGPEALGPYIKHLREARGWTQAQLAQNAGYSQGTISRIETGKTVPAVGVLLDVLRPLSVALTLEVVCGS
jgi:transcriptional regulator with XRE-family HTH domain